MPGAVRRAASAGSVLLLWGVSSGLTLWLGSVLPNAPEATRLVATQVLCIALPTGVYVAIRRLRGAPVLPRLRAPWAAWLGAALLGAGVPACVTLLAIWCARAMPWPGEPITGPFPPADVAVQVSSWAAGLALVTLPALCEEPLYRGAMLREFRVQLGAPCAVLACALLFALAHWEAYGILPRTVLGVAFGYAAVASSSLGPAIACHAVCNGVSLVLAATQHSAGPPWGLPTWLLPAVAWSVGSVFAGCALLGRGEGRRPLRVRSDAAELAGVRAEVEGWAARTGLDPAGVQATVAAVHEAVLNAIEHGNGGDPSRWVTVEFRDAPDRVEIRVGDEGGGVPPESDRQPPPHDRGRGIALMRGLMDDVRFAQGRGLVTLVKTKQGRGVGP